MAQGDLPQKRISQLYDGAAGYPARPHYFRRLRGWLFAFAAVASIVGALAFAKWGGSRIYNPGPISQNHARFTKDCRVCHLDADDVFFKFGTLARATSAAPGAGAAGGGNEPAGAALERMDAACLQCHGGTRLHVPQAASLGFRAVAEELPIVHATHCATCHREHAGHERMALPGAQSCTTCHNDAGKLAAARTLMTAKFTPVAASGENRDLGDGVIRFLAPAQPPEKFPLFPSYEKGHPPFAYEQPGVRDPAALKFNHRTHLRGIAYRLDCASCHQPGADGIYMQPVKYERHCAQCHSLQFQPSLPALRIPHRDPGEVRYFLLSREDSFEHALRAEGVTDPEALRQRVQAEMQALHQRGLDDLHELEQRVYFEGDPPDVEGDRHMRDGNAKFLTECAKCHVVHPGDAGQPPKVEPPMMADRWVQHGPFTHLPHQHMSCIDCHGAAPESTRTSDILLPPQKLCAECHRAPAAMTDSTAPAPVDGRAVAAAQRANGGIKWDCTSCHTFHAPPDAERMIKAIAPAPDPGGNARAN